MSRTLLPGFLDRAAITLLTGASHAGKTTLLGQLLKACLCGNDFIGIPVPTHLHVGLLMAGDAKPLQDTVDTFADIGVTLDPARISSSLEYPVHNPHTSTDLLLTALSDMPSSDLYIIEGLTAFISPIQVNNYHAPLFGLKELTGWAAARQCSILGTHHLGKLDTGGKPRRPLDRVLGTTALVGNVSHCAVLETPEELKSPNYRLTLYHRRAKTQTLFLTRADSPGGPFERVDLSVREEGLETFLAAIPQAPESVHIKELYKVGPSERTVKRWVEELGEAGRIERVGKGYYRKV